MYPTPVRQGDEVPCRDLTGNSYQGYVLESWVVPQLALTCSYLLKPRKSFKRCLMVLNPLEKDTTQRTVQVQRHVDNGLLT